MLPVGTQQQRAYYKLHALRQKWLHLSEQDKNEYNRRALQMRLQSSAFVERLTRLARDQIAAELSAAAAERRRKVSPKYLCRSNGFYAPKPKKKKKKSVK
eukprot:PhM_4_TR12446/c0_g1_i1/m.83249